MKFTSNIFLQETLENNSSKYYFIRYNSEIYECEEFTINQQGEVSDLRFFPIDKDQFQKLTETMLGSNLISYFGKKNMGWSAFGETYKP